MRVYDPEAGCVLLELEGFTDGVNGVKCFEASWAPHRPHVAAVSNDCNAKVWDGEDGRLVCSLRGHTRYVITLAVYKEHVGGRDRIVTACNDYDIKVWDAETGALVHTLQGHQDAPVCLATFKSAGGAIRLVSG
jgi:WD40 repeat protein